MPLRQALVGGEVQDLQDVFVRVLEVERRNARRSLVPGRQQLRAEEAYST